MMSIGETDPDAIVYSFSVCKDEDESVSCGQRGKKSIPLQTCNTDRTKNIKATQKDMAFSALQEFISNISMLTDVEEVKAEESLSVTPDLNESQESDILTAIIGFLMLEAQ
ncbi:hypothetical protein PROFUN_00112 [Planoprotostelium fungivorum]|uniref:Uncharacterized protein n=1 Tax=Planoprotostelium fungivorum TaxID=1890364 RepID=A0A2P6P0P8_9EUKA|nr:hypothetical protein PROFUN_00112 [Planoprotostelium fungivorum]